MDDDGWTDAVTDEAERLIPTLLEAGYIVVDDEAWTWCFSEAGKARAAQLEAERDRTPDNS